MKIIHSNIKPKNVVNNIIYEVYITDENKTIPYLEVAGFKKEGRLKDSEHIPGFIRFLKMFNKDYSPLKLSLPTEINESHQASIHNYITGLFVGNYLTKSKNASGIETAINLAKDSKTHRIFEDNEGNRISELDMYTKEDTNSKAYINKCKRDLKKELLRVHIINNKYDINIISFLPRLFINNEFIFTTNFIKSEVFYQYKTGEVYTNIYSNSMKDLVNNLNNKSSKERITLLKISELCKEISVVPKSLDAKELNKESIESLISDVLIENEDIIKLIHKDVSIYFQDKDGQEFLNTETSDLYTKLKSSIHCIENINIVDGENVEILELLKDLNFVPKGIKYNFDSNGILMTVKNTPRYFNLGETTTTTYSFNKCLYHKSGIIFSIDEQGDLYRFNNEILELMHLIGSDDLLTSNGKVIYNQKAITFKEGWMKCK